MSTTRPILIVEDDDELREVLMEHLGAENTLSPTGAASLGEAAHLLNGTDARFDAVVLDVNLPDGDGRDFCAQLRRRGVTMPIIMLSRRRGRDRCRSWPTFRSQ